MLTVNSRTVASADDLSANFQLLLGTVPLGREWLAWAIADRTAGPLAVPTEADLLRAIQSGLHGNPVTFFPAAGLQIDLALILDLSDEAIAKLADSFATGQLTPEVQSILAWWKIYTEADFAQAKVPFADSPAAAPLLASASLADLVALRTLMPDWTATPADLKAAVSFALQLAATASSLVELVGFHLALAQAGIADPASVWTQLAPLAFPLLSCQTAAPGTPDPALRKQIADKPITGFATHAHAMRNLAAHGKLGLPRPGDQALAAAIGAYFASAKTIVAAQPDDGSVRFRTLQDGVTRWCEFDNSAGAARYQLDSAGHLTLLELAPA